MGVKERKAREFKRRETDILDAALSLFEVDDWLSVTVGAIAERAEVGKGTVYEHFDSKEELYARLAVRFHHGILDELRDIDSTLPAVQQLRALVRVFFDAHRNGSPYRKILEYTSRPGFLASLDAEAVAAYSAVQGEIRGAVERILRGGVEAGEFADRSLDVLSFQTMGTLRGMHHMMASGAVDETDPRAYLEQMTDFIVGGVVYQDRVPGRWVPSGGRRWGSPRMHPRDPRSSSSGKSILKRML